MALTDALPARMDSQGSSTSQRVIQVENKLAASARVPKRSATSRAMLPGASLAKPSFPAARSARRQRVHRQIASSSCSRKKWYWTTTRSSPRSICIALLRPPACTHTRRTASQRSRSAKKSRGAASRMHAGMTDLLAITVKEAGTRSRRM